MCWFVCMYTSDIDNIHLQNESILLQSLWTDNLNMHKGYTLFRTSSKPSEDSNEPQSATETATEAKEKDARSEKEEENENFEPTVVLPEPSKLILTTSPTVTAKEVLKPKFSPEEQQDVFKWMLAERRKVRPRNEAEKVQLDAEKTLLKEYIRKKSVLIA